MSSDSNHNSHRRHSRDPQPDHPTLPPVNRLPPLRTVWMRRSPTSQSVNPTPRPQRHHPVERRNPEDTSSTRNPTSAAEVLDELVSRHRSRQIGDRNFQVEFDDLLGQAPEAPSPPPGWAFEGGWNHNRASVTDGADYRARFEDRHRRARIRTAHASAPDVQRFRAAAAIVRAHLVGESDEPDSRNQPSQAPLLGFENIRSLTDDFAEDTEPSSQPTERARSRARLTFQDEPLSPLLPEMPLNMSPPLRPEYPEDNRRVKRRKLDSDRLASGFKGFRYGRYGQVDPGELKMEIVSCDGGLFSNESSYAYENILKNDKSVYCTKSSRCNIVLRHQGATVFSLKELVIKAPGSNYSSPVREGMVFVSMNQDELLTRTAQYQIQYVPSEPRSRFVRNREGLWVERETLPLAPIISIRHHENGTTVSTRSQARARRLYSIGGVDDDSGHRTAHMPLEFTTALPPFNITTECSDEESDDDAARVPITRRAPNRIGSLPFESESSDEGIPFASNEYGFDDYEPFSNRNRARAEMTLAEAAEAHQAATQEAVRAVGGELMAPHARFYVEKDKSKCTIRFDPPVSGRFILLKMWSPHRESGSNIDIQAVIARGFAGPRYFPSVQLR